MREPALCPDEDLITWPPGQEKRARRRPSSLRVRCGPLTPADGEPTWQAQVRDLSAFGAGLLLAEPPSISALMRLDLDAGGAARPVLARVIHGTPHGSGWLAGCAFVRELDGAALLPFRAERVPAPAGDNRRWARSRCDVEAACYSLDTTPGERSAARVLDVSAGGVGLLLPCEFGPGTLLLLGLGGTGASAPRLLLRVARSARAAAGGWLLGCEFADWLADPELDALCGEGDARP